MNELIVVSEKILERNGKSYQINTDIPFTGYAVRTYNSGQWIKELNI